MNLGIKEAMNIAIECILFGFIVLIIAFFSIYAKEALIIKDNENIQMREIEEYRNLYEFTIGYEMNLEDFNSLITVSSKSLKDYNTDDVKKILSNVNTKLVYRTTKVKGEDIIRFIGLYPKEYNLIILQMKSSDTNNNGVEIYKLLTTNPDDNWLLSSVMNKIGSNNTKEFYCMAIYDTTNYCYDSILFIETDIV